MKFLQKLIKIFCYQIYTVRFKTRGKQILERLGSAQFFDASNFPALFLTCFTQRKAHEILILSKIHVDLMNKSRFFL